MDYIRSPGSGVQGGMGGRHTVALLNEAIEDLFARGEARHFIANHLVLMIQEAFGKHYLLDV